MGRKQNEVFNDIKFSFKINKNILILKKKKKFRVPTLVTRQIRLFLNFQQINQKFIQTSSIPTIKKKLINIIISLRPKLFVNNM